MALAVAADGNADDAVEVDEEDDDDDRGIGSSCSSSADGARTTLRSVDRSGRHGPPRGALAHPARGEATAHVANVPLPRSCK